MKLKLFWGKLVNAFFMRVAKSNLPLLWKIEILNLRMKWRIYKRHFKDQLLGKLTVITVSVDKDWEFVQGKHTCTRVRDITYRWRRANIPFAYPKVFRGTQCTDETAYPLGRIPHDVVAKVNDQVFECNQLIRASNEKHDRQQQLKASIVNHKFQEYDHDL